MGTRASQDKDRVGTLSPPQTQALLLTLLCEVPLILCLAAPAPWRRLGVIALVAISASLLTHPMAWWLAGTLAPWEVKPGLLLIETGVVVLEALWYALWLRLGGWRALAWSLAANGLSFWVGS